MGERASLSGRNPQQRWRWVVPAIVALGILIGSVMPVPVGGGPGAVLPFLPADKVAHFSLYLALAASLAWAWSDWPGDPWRVGLLLFGLVFLYGAGIEVVQYFIPSRAFSVLDMAANGFGAAAGVLAGWIVVRRRGS